MEDMMTDPVGREGEPASMEAALAELATMRKAHEALASEGERLRKQVVTFEARRAREERAHEAMVSKLRADADRDVVQAEVRAAAVRMGAHNPDDVLRLLDLSEIVRGEDGQVAGCEAVLERARAERGYLFGAAVASGAVSGNTVGAAAPRPGRGGPFDARGASAADYEARKMQFLRSGG